MSLFKKKRNEELSLLALESLIENCPNVVSLADLESEDDNNIEVSNETGVQSLDEVSSHSVMSKSTRPTNIKDILNDIVNYVLDHFSLKQYVIGVVVDSTKDASVGISVKKFGIKADFDVMISTDYSVRGEECEKSQEPHELSWIEEDFKDIKTAVDHNAKRFERVETIDKNSSIGGSIDFKVVNIGASYQNRNKLRIYIFFEQYTEIGELI